MALNFFRKKKADAATGAAGAPAEDKGFKRDPRKARKFFEHAQAVADARNYDYAIDCYVNGLRHEPDNMKAHEALYEVAKRRKVGGGKPAGFMEQMKGGGRDALDKMLHAEMVWAKNPTDVPCMRTFMEKAVDAAEAYEGLELGEVAFWAATLVLEANHSQKKPDKSTYLKACEVFERIDAYGKAVDACKLALALNEDDESLLLRLRDLEAERTMRDAQYGSSYRESVRDTDKQKQLEIQDTGAKTANQMEQQIAQRRLDHEESPEDLDKLLKLVNALKEKGTDQSEDEAMGLLREAWERTGQYRLKVMLGDIQMRQYSRRLRGLMMTVKAAPDDADTRAQYELLHGEALQFELDEFTERVKNYPTDMKLRYELGRRLMAFRRYDEAIAAFQEAQADPKNRAVSLNYMGKACIEKGWFDVAIETLRRGIDAHPLKDDALGMDLRYQLMDALDKSARRNRSLDHARQARDVASQILQMKIDYRDIRQRVDALQKLVDDLAAG